MPISIPQPAMAINQDDPFLLPKYRMTNTWNVNKNTSPEHIIGWAAKVFQQFKSSSPGVEATLVINCHGFATKTQGGFGLHLGTGITNYTHARLFEKLSPYVDTIYVIACQAAGIAEGGIEGKDGNLLCGAIAKAAKATLYASTADQYGPPWMAFGMIDDFEGDVYRYLADGSCSKMDGM